VLVAAPGRPFGAVRLPGRHPVHPHVGLPRVVIRPQSVTGRPGGPSMCLASPRGGSSRR
jgi:hypothetical protein